MTHAMYRQLWKDESQMGIVKLNEAPSGQRW